MGYLNMMNCCGIKELAPIESFTPDGAIRNVARRTMWGPSGRKDVLEWPTNFRFLIFSQAGTRAKYGTNMVKFIEDNKLGTVVEGGNGINPNSRRRVRVWVWTVDHDAVRAWLSTQKP
jgi:hypothetical protein